MRTCPKCGTSIEHAPGTHGRPPLYCSETCRRLAEFEIRRINRHMETLEASLSNLRINGFDMFIAATEAEIARQEARLRALIEGNASTTEAS
jgi:hypothetical protein